MGPKVSLMGNRRASTLGVVVRKPSVAEIRRADAPRVRMSSGGYYLGDLTAFGRTVGTTLSHRETKSLGEQRPRLLADSNTEREHVTCVTDA